MSQYSARSSLPQAIHATVKKQSYEDWVFTAVCGSPNNQMHTQLWDNLANFSNLDDKPWMATGDFNDIADSSERRGHEIVPEDNKIRRLFMLGLDRN